MIIHTSEGGGGSFDLSIDTELFTRAKTVEKSFQKDFKESYMKMQNVYKKMEADDGFKSKACEGFMELFDILLQYHKDLVEETPALFKIMNEFSSSLNEIRSTSVYKELY